MINEKNVKELWILYESYKEEFYKRNYSDQKCEDFESYIENNVTKCNNCQRYILNEDIGFNELALQDNICINCMDDGYGS